MRILVACEYSGTVRDAFRKLGHDAWSCDLLPCDADPQWHYQGDVVEMLTHRWDLIIAHPPCTFLSVASACRLYPTKGNIDKDRFAKGLEAKAFFLRLLNADCPKICVENPVSLGIFEMPKYTQEVQPYMFGHPVTKKTRLWLKNLPPLLATNTVTPLGPFIPAGTSRKDKTKYGARECFKSAKNRSKTFQGIADAMAQQWGS
jgi:hypothetical protein